MGCDLRECVALEGKEKKGARNSVRVANISATVGFFDNDPSMHARHKCPFGLDKLIIH